MTTNRSAVLETLIKHSSGGDSLWDFLPESVKPKLSFKKISFDSLSFNLKWLTQVHYSWFLPVLKKLPPSLIKLILNTLPLSLARKLQPLLSITDFQPQELSSFSALFLLDFLNKKIRPLQLLEKFLLPEIELSDLLTCSISQCLTLINSLGMYDLAFELKYTVDKQVITQLYNLLSEQQKNFLNYYLKKPSSFINKTPSGLTPMSFKKPLLLKRDFHKKGLIRLAQGLAEENGSFLWYLLRRFDIGRAQIIEQHLKQNIIKERTTYFKKQIVYYLTILKK